MHNYSVVIGVFALGTVQVSVYLSPEHVLYSCMKWYIKWLCQHFVFLFFCFCFFFFFFFNDTATTEIYTLSLHTLFRSATTQLGDRSARVPMKVVTSCDKLRVGACMPKIRRWLNRTSCFFGNGRVSDREPTELKHLSRWRK